MVLFIGVVVVEREGSRLGWAEFYAGMRLTSSLPLIYIVSRGLRRVVGDDEYTYTDDTMRLYTVYKVVGQEKGRTLAGG